MSYFNEIADYATYSGHEADSILPIMQTVVAVRLSWAVDFMTKTVS